MPTHLRVLVPSMVLVLADLPRAETSPLPPDTQPRAPLGRPGGLRTERLSRKQLQVWGEIVAIVTAKDPSGEPLQPTLHRLWDAVGSSSHVIYIEMADRKRSRSYLAGGFTAALLGWLLLDLALSRLLRGGAISAHSIDIGGVEVRAMFPGSGMWSAIRASHSSGPIVSKFRPRVGLCLSPL
jgi:hypothetical protein